MHVHWSGAEPNLVVLVSMVHTEKCSLHRSLRRPTQNSTPERFSVFTESEIFHIYVLSF